MTNAAPITLRSTTRNIGFAASIGFALSLLLEVAAGFSPYEIAPFIGGTSTFVLIVSFVVFLVWTFMLFKDLEGRTKYGAGIAVGGWFIPLANFVLPALTLRDAARALNDGKGGVVFLWWLTYLGYTFVNVSHRVFIELVNNVDEFNRLFENPNTQWMFVTFYWTKVVFEVLAFGGLSALVVRMSTRGAGDEISAAAPAHA